MVKALADLPTVARPLGDAEGDIANIASELGWADTRIARLTAALPSPMLPADLAAHLKRHRPLALAAEAARRELRNKDAEVARLADQPADLPDATGAAPNTASRGYRRIDFDVIPALPRAETKTACAKAGH